jgi:hypothetical protein
MHRSQLANRCRDSISRCSGREWCGGQYYGANDFAGTLGMPLFSMCLNNVYAIQGRTEGLYSYLLTAVGHRVSVLTSDGSQERSSLCGRAVNPLNPPEPLNNTGPRPGLVE